MSNKPIQRSEFLVPFSREHHFILLFCWKIRIGVKGTINVTRINNYIKYFSEHILEQHFAEEEAILFIKSEIAPVQRALNDHKNIGEEVQLLLSQNFDTSKKILNLADTLDAHVRFEERILFPSLEKALSSAQMEEIHDIVVSPAFPQLKDNYADQFWVNYGK